MAIKCCRNCVPPKRYPGCHDKCNKYLEEKAKWEEAKAKSGEKTEEEEKQEAEELIKQVSEANNAQFAGLMSKYNKGYVGRFSNLSTTLVCTLLVGQTSNKIFSFLIFS